MSYALTLTHEERKAFDWVGYRYAAGDIARLLWLECCAEDVEWDGEAEITFSVPEAIAWQIRDLAEQEECLWPCFGSELTEKLNAFIILII